VVKFWRLDAARAVGTILAVLPGLLVTQVLVQGDLQGLIGVTAHSHAIRVLGVSLPGASVLIGIPIGALRPTPSAGFGRSCPNRLT
jgi:hypothetical protein